MGSEVCNSIIVPRTTAGFIWHAYKAQHGHAWAQDSDAQLGLQLTPRAAQQHELATPAT